MRNEGEESLRYFDRHDRACMLARCQLIVLCTQVKCTELLHSKLIEGCTELKKESSPSFLIVNGGPHAERESGALAPG